jgi:phosphate transport system substrate-binding protein
MTPLKELRLTALGFISACACQLAFASVNTSLEYQQKSNSRSSALASITAMPETFSDFSQSEPVVTLFSMHGSNTIGGSLAPNMAISYLKAKGAKNLRIEPLATPNEKVVIGDLKKQGKSVQIKILAHGSSTGFNGLMSDDAQVWASSRPVKSKEIKQAKSKIDLTSHVNEHILAIDGLAIVVNKNNNIGELSKAQLGAIYSGEINNWSELGGENRNINLYARDKNSGTWDSFKNMVLAKQYSLHERAKRFESSEELVDNVVSDIAGIGFVGMGFVGESKLLAISDGPAQGFKPSPLTLATEDYPLSRRLFLYSNANHNAYADEFINYAEGVYGQEIVMQQGFVSQNVSSMEGELQKNLPEDYVGLVQGAKRLSTNFRFQPGSAKLDNKAIKDIKRLAYFIRSQQKHLPEDQQLEHGRKLMLIGFGDKRKSSARSKLISKLRAMAVRRELARLGIYPGQVKGYGDFNPVAAYEGTSGLKNRRVEVWLR